MSRKLQDLTGQTFGRLTVIRRARHDEIWTLNPNVQWVCKCSCGIDEPIIVSGNSLKLGRTKSCGCLRREMTRKRMLDTHPVGKSGARGVKFIEKTGKYVARICVNYKTIHIGTYDTVEEAIAARRKAEEKYRGK